MKKLLILASILSTLIACEKNKNIDDLDSSNKSDRIDVKFQEYSGQRGDILTAKTINFDSSKVEILFTVFDTTIPCALTNVSESSVSFQIPDASTLINSHLNALIDFGSVACNIKAQNNETKQKISSTLFTLNYNPRITNIIPSSDFISGDTLALTGRDLDIKTLNIVFNSLSARIIFQSASSVKAIIPDSTNNGKLKIKIYHGLFVPNNRTLLSRDYIINTKTNLKVPKSASLSFDGSSNYVYNLKYNLDNQLIGLDLFNMLGELYGVYYKTYTYNNSHQMIFSTLTKNGEFYQVDSFMYSQNLIIEKNYKNDTYNQYEDTIILERKVEYIVNDEGIITESTFYRRGDDDKMYKYQSRSFNFSGTSCSYNETSYNQDNISGSTDNIIEYNPNIKGMPLQLKTLINGNTPTFTNDLDLMYFPGTLLSKYRTFYNSTYIDADLYYDADGNLIIEKYYFVDYHDNTRKLLRTIHWEY